VADDQDFLCIDVFPHGFLIFCGIVVPETKFTRRIHTILTGDKPFVSHYYFFLQIYIRHDSLALDQLCQILYLYVLKHITRLSNVCIAFVMMIILNPSIVKLQFAKYIMHNSRVLRTMTIGSADKSVETNTKHQMFMELSLCPKVSATCQLLFI
jgi:hypothetical protein